MSGVKKSLFRSPASPITPTSPASAVSAAAAVSPLVCRFLISRVSSSTSSSLSSGSGSDATKKDTIFALHPSDLVAHRFVTGQWLIASSPSNPAFPPFVGLCWPSQSVRQGATRVFVSAELCHQVREGEELEFHRIPDSIPSISSVGLFRHSSAHASAAAAVSSVSSASASSSSALSNSVTSYFLNFIQNRIFLIENQEFRIKLFGQQYDLIIRSLEFSNEKNNSAMPNKFRIGRIVKSTKIRMETKNEMKSVNTDENQSNSSESVTDSGIDFSSIGGLSSQLELIREVIEFPLSHADFFEKYEIRPPRGILLFGPAGTGKTLIARALAASNRAKFYSISGPEIVSKFVGESESKLRTIFATAAANAPAIIFIDEIDSICPKRELIQEEMPKRLVATLLTLLDGVSNGNARIAVIAATNRPDSLDSAIRRAGRFDREIEIGIPNSLQRLEIMHKFLSKMPNQLKDEEIRQIAEITHGYVGADLKALCAEAAVNAINRTQKGDNIASEARHDNVFSRSFPPLDSLFITFLDLQMAATQIRPSCMREILVEIPQTRWSDIGGQHETKARLQESVEWPIQNPEAFIRLGITPPKGVLLYGPPGCSKSLMAKALACESSRNFISVKGPELFNKYVGESEKAIRELFRKARAAAPSIVFFDEIDSIAAARSSGDGDSGADRVSERVLSQLLVELDGIEPLKQVSVIAATNRPDLIDRALLRPGRIDRILYVPPPDLDSAKQILLIQLKKMAHSNEIEDRIDELARICEGFSGAEIVNVCREAGFQCMKENLQANQIEWKHFESAARAVKPQITAEMKLFYEQYAAKSNLARC